MAAREEHRRNGRIGHVTECRKHEPAGADQMRRNFRRRGPVSPGLSYAAGEVLLLSSKLRFQPAARMCRQTCARIANGRGIGAAGYTENSEAVFGIVLEIRRFIRIQGIDNQHVVPV